MTAFIIIAIILIILFIFYKLKNKKDDAIEESTKQESFSSKKYITGIQGENNWLKDEDGQEYQLVLMQKDAPRRTYIKAHLNGKYWGEIDEHYSNQFQQSEYYDFNIYEVILNNASYKTDAPFQLEEDLRIPRERLPKLLNTVLEKDGKTYELNLHEPVYSSIKFNRRLHQSEGSQVFGTIDATVTGYILDFVKEDYYEKVYRVISPTPHSKENVKTSRPTGNVEYNGNYKKTEYYYSDYKKTYWSEWEYKKTSVDFDTQGCFSTFIGIITAIFGIAFLLMLLPQLVFFIPFILIIIMLYIIPAKAFQWIFRIIGALILLVFIYTLFQISPSQSSKYNPKPVVVNHPEEARPQIEPIVDSVKNKPVIDTLIVNHRVWQDYDGNTYEGKFWTKKSDYLKAKYFKQNFPLNANNEESYDFMIYSIKENDKDKLNGIYQMFDSIQNRNQFSHIKFAELIVSFIQDIPYTLILPYDCDPSKYDDLFVWKYLSEPNARCAGHEKFGINSPVEFMSNLNGDCDTRTLLIYTMLSHYGYDIVLLSSEYYGHSIIGINLPISGVAYQYQEQRYVLWETTAPNFKPGLLPTEISNLNYWRISLKSK